MTVQPATLYPGARTTLSATVSDPDDPVTQVELSWAFVGKRCDDATAADWSATRETSGSRFVIEPPARVHAPLCVRARARDPHGAEAVDSADFAVTNREPSALLIVDGLVEGVPLPRFRQVRLIAAGTDADMDDLTYQFSAKRGDVAVPLADCGTAAAPGHCFVADLPGPYEAQVQVSDGRRAVASPPVRFTVAEDQPPCIAVSDPELHTAVAIPAAGVRRFEVRQVKDDGHPFPAGPHGAATFYWYVHSAGRGWARLADQHRPYLDVSPALFFDEVRPGETVKIRVEVRDPERESRDSLAALAAACVDKPTCEQPTGCVRAASWSVEFR